MNAQVLDTMDIERERGITIKAQSVTLDYKAKDGIRYQLNFIDTPGHVDFTVEVNRSLRVLDGLVFLFSAVDGVEPQSETNWRLADNYKVPRIGFVNKMDRQGSNFLMVCKQVREMLGSKAVPIVLPIGDEGDFRGIVDLAKNRAIVWHEEGFGSTFDVVPIPEEMKADVKEHRAALIEAVAEYDEELMEKFFEDEDSITEEEVHAALRAAVMDRAIIPMICGSSFKNKGVQFLLDAVCRYLPSPLDKEAIVGTDPDTGEPISRKPSVKEPFSALAFKIATDPIQETSSGRPFWDFDTVVNANKAHAVTHDGIECFTVAMQKMSFAAVTKCDHGVRVIKSGRISGPTVFVNGGNDGNFVAVGSLEQTFFH